MSLRQLSAKWHQLYSKRLVVLIFLVPALVLFTLFSWRPIIWGFWISLFDYPLNPDLPPKYIGLENYSNLFTDPLFYKAWVNVIIFTILALIIGYLVPVALAIAINEMRHLQSVLRLGYYLPVIIPLVVVVLIWRYLYEAETGLFDSVVRLLGFHAVGWIQNKNTALLSLVIMSTWKNAGATMIIYLAALQGVPPQLYEAAEIDGANIWQRIKNITIPQILPIMLIMLILQIIGTVQLFVEPYIMYRGGSGPSFAAYTVIMHIYNTAFLDYELGKASAISVILFVVLVSFTFVYFWLLKKFRRS